MSKEISKQEKEDYLSLMYEMKRKENQIVKSDLSREFEVPLSRVTRVTDGLLEEGYLLKDEGRRLENEQKNTFERWGSPRTIHH